MRMFCWLGFHKWETWWSGDIGHGCRIINQRCKRCGKYSDGKIGDRCYFAWGVVIGLLAGCGWTLATLYLLEIIWRN